MWLWGVVYVHKFKIQPHHHTVFSLSPLCPPPYLPNIYEYVIFNKFSNFWQKQEIGTQSQHGAISDGH